MLYSNPTRRAWRQRLVVAWVRTPYGLCWPMPSLPGPEQERKRKVYIYTYIYIHISHTTPFWLFGAWDGEGVRTHTTTYPSHLSSHMLILRNPRQEAFEADRARHARRQRSRIDVQCYRVEWPDGRVKHILLAHERVKVVRRNSVVNGVKITTVKWIKWPDTPPRRPR